MTLDEAIKEFVLACGADGLSPATCAWYKSLLGSFAEWVATGEIPQSTPGDRRHVERFNDGTTAEVPQCPRCAVTERQIKIGKNASGSARRKCQRCGCKYTPNINR